MLAEAAEPAKYDLVETELALSPKARRSKLRLYKIRNFLSTSPYIVFCLRWRPEPFSDKNIIITGFRAFHAANARIPVYYMDVAMEKRPFNR
jgi:hypothetical protein